MIRKFAALLALVLVLPSCDKNQSESASGSNTDSGKRSTRADGPSRDLPSTRDKLRAAFDSAKAMKPGEDRDKAIAEVAWLALESAPDIAAAIIRELPAGSGEKDSLIEAYIRKLLEEEKSDEALAWADSLGDERDIAFARGKTLVMLAEKNPEQATKLLPASDFTAAGVNPATGEVLQTWVMKSPADAVAWTTRLPSGEARTAGYKVLFSQWFDTDSKSALSWVATQTNPQVRQEAISGIVGIFVDQPGLIRGNLLESADPSLRAEIESRVAELAPPDAEPMPETESTPADESEPSPESP